MKKPKKRGARSGAYIRESTVEQYLVKCVEAVESEGFKGVCEKHVSPGRRGVPDRLVTWPWNAMDLVETKAPEGRLSPAQERDHARRSVYVWKCWTKQRVAVFVHHRCVNHGIAVPAIVLRHLANP